MATGYAWHHGLPVWLGKAMLAGVLEEDITTNREAAQVRAKRVIRQRTQGDEVACQRLGHLVQAALLD